MYLYHYYEETVGSFMNLSDLSLEEAETIQNKIKTEGKAFASKRSEDYLLIRRSLEQIAREFFISKGGKPIRERPHYMTLGECEWLKTWYNSGKEIKIHLNEFDPQTISFTYGDLFPTMRYEDGKEYRKQIYTLNEIKRLIDKYGFPQIWNQEGQYGPERYIEVQVWDDKPLMKYVGTV